MNPIPINLAVEDQLSEVVLLRMLDSVLKAFAVRAVYSRGGVGYLRKMISGFNNAAKGTPFLVLADLDMGERAPKTISEWLPHGAHSNLILRIAVREVEAWLLADASAFAKFLGVRAALVPSSVEALSDPKQTLVNIARKSTRSDVRSDLVPKLGSTAVVGRNYNARLHQFVMTSWRPDVARANANSLGRALDALAAFVPVWGTP